MNKRDFVKYVCQYIIAIILICIYVFWEYGTLEKFSYDGFLMATAVYVAGVFLRLRFQKIDKK